MTGSARPRPKVAVRRVELEVVNFAVEVARRFELAFHESAVDNATASTMGLKFRIMSSTPNGEGVVDTEILPVFREDRGVIPGEGEV